jgi:hypothetical protein
MKLKRMIALLAAGCMLVATGSLSGCGNNNSNEGAYVTQGYVNGNTNGNISNLGGVAEYNGKLYYQNGDDNFSVYCSDVNGENAVKINDCQSYFINVLKDYIIYANADDDYHIYKMKLDGSENTKLNDAESYYVSVENDVVY